MTLYDILEVSSDASDEEIKIAYRSLAKKYHPDGQTEYFRKVAEERMKQINYAYEILSNPQKRAHHDSFVINLKSEVKNDASSQSKTSNSNNSKSENEYVRENSQDDKTTMKENDDVTSAKSFHERVQEREFSGYAKNSNVNIKQVHPSISKTVKVISITIVILIAVLYISGYRLAYLNSFEIYKTSEKNLLVIDSGVYLGGVKDGVPDGKGTMIFKDGRVFKGVWDYGERNGEGTLEFVDGAKAVGRWKNDIRDGEMVTQYSDGKIVKSYSSYDYINNKITIRWDTGNSYIGGWKDDVRNGYGIDKFYDGSMYEGQYKNGLYDGQGTLTDKDGQVYKGIWSQDKLVQIE